MEEIGGNTNASRQDKVEAMSSGKELIFILIFEFLYVLSQILPTIKVLISGLGGNPALSTNARKLRDISPYD